MGFPGGFDEKFLRFFVQLLKGKRFIFLHFLYFLYEILHIVILLLSVDEPSLLSILPLLRVEYESIDVYCVLVKVVAVLIDQIP